ncbi:MAG TPA: outer membrane beta-barrel protein [Hyphomonadaceae bacterium]|nr:outer membrane beta-barrel protein [Hyphomonadaceae bacterium]
MKFGFRKIILSTVFAGLAAPAALAQSADNPFERGRYTAVTERSQADFDPEPIRAGAFNVWSNLGLSAAYNDNIFAEDNGPDDDTVIHIRPQVDARSNWTSHALNAGVLVDHKEYVANDSETTTDYRAYADGRLDVQRSFALTGNVNAGHTTEERYEPASATSPEPAQYNTLGASAGARFRTDRVQIEGSASTLDYDFDDGFDYRDETENALFARASYAISPDIAVFVQGTHSEQDYEDPGSVTNPNRDGTRTNVQLGASFELQAPFRGEIAVGSVQEDKDDPVWADTDGLSVDGRLYWFPTQLTTVTFRATEGVFDPGILEAASAQRSNYGVRVDHELRRNIIIFGDIGFSRYDYEGLANDPTPFDREDKYTDFEAGFAYKINRHMHAEFSYRLHNQESSGADADPTRLSFDQNIISAGLKFYP